MPKFKIETTAQIRRIYIVEAEDEHQAEIIVDDRGDSFMVHEEDISEEIDDIIAVAETPSPDQATVQDRGAPDVAAI